MDKERLSHYVECVTGTIQPRDAKDVCALLYSLVPKMLEYADMLKDYSPYKNDIVRRNLMTIAGALQVNAKFYEGVPFQKELF